MTKLIYIAGIILILWGLSGLLFKKVDLNNTSAVNKEMQGTWIGNSHDGFGEFQYVHYKVIIFDNKFKGWIQVARTSDEPQWNSEPDVTGEWSLSEVLTYTNSSGRYRNIFFNTNNDENLLKARTLQNVIIYDGGLYVVGWGTMSKK